MEKGISLYLGMENTLQENITFLQSAAQFGITRVFTSLQIPEAKHDQLSEDLQKVLETCCQLGLDVIADVSPAGLQKLQIQEFSLEAIHQLGLRTIRLDDGFTLEDIASMSHNQLGIRLQLNASTLSQRDLQELKDLHCDFSQLEALHNFFPHCNTGLSEKFVYEKNCLFHSFGLSVGAFVPSFQNPRGPLYDGLPTLEIHRHTSFDFACRHLAAMGTDSIFIGDPLPSDLELTDLSQVNNDAVTLKLFNMKDNNFNKALLTHTFTTRPDVAQDVIRTIESRQYTGDILQKSGTQIEPDNNIFRPRGTVTVDNYGYQRYQGELQITLTDLPADERVNVIGCLDENEQLLLTYLKPQTKFKILLNHVY